MRTRKRICAAVLTAVFAAVLCLTGCSRAPRLYEGVWAAEDLEVNGLSIDRLEMAVELCAEEPAWDEYDTFRYPDRDGEWSIYFRIYFDIFRFIHISYIRELTFRKALTFSRNRDDYLMILFGTFYDQPSQKRNGIDSIFLRNKHGRHIEII